MKQLVKPTRLNTTVMMATATTDAILYMESVNSQAVRHLLYAGLSATASQSAEEAH